MFDPIDNDLRAAATALRDVVAPAVDPANPIAQQQLKLVLDWLEFYRQRAPQAWRLDAFELSSQAALARAVLAAVPPGQGEALTQALQAAAEAGALAREGPARLRAAVTALEDALSATVRASTAFPLQMQREVERLVVAGTRPWLLAQRAWYSPLSIEPDPQALPHLDDALRPIEATPDTLP